MFMQIMHKIRKIPYAIATEAMLIFHLWAFWSIETPTTGVYLNT